NVIGHRAIGALDHQIEHLVVYPRLARDVKCNKAKENAETHEGKGGGEPHYDHNHNEGEHQEPKCRITHVFNSPPIPRWRAASSILCAFSMAILRDSSSTYSLCASCSSMTSISATSFSRSGHSPILRQTTQRTISAMPCSITSAP